MFKQFISKLTQVCRFDKLTSTKDIKIGEVENASGETELAIQTGSGETLTLEPRATAQLGSLWGIPSAHLERLPRELAAEELLHFSRSDPRDITIRAVQADGQKYAAARSVLSGKYSPFDSAEVLSTIEPFMEGWTISSANVERDEMRLLATLPQQYDVSPRRVGDITKAGLVISNSEIGTMALRVDYSMFRLVCTNGMIAADQAAARVRHIYVDRPGFIARLREAVSSAALVGQQMARRLEATHSLLLPNLDVEKGRLQQQVVSILRQSNLWTQAFERSATEALGTREESSVYGLIQFLTDSFAKDAPLAQRVHRERTAGKLMALAV